MGFLRRNLRLPSPVELGWSDSDALMLREITPYQEGKSWEDWHEHCRSHYPVRYFLVATLPREFKRRILWPLERAMAWILDHCVARRRYHLFDLRGLDPLSDYSHGYLDPSHVFWLAGWGALLRWHRENRHHQDPRLWMTLEEQADPENHSRLASYDELQALVLYWTVTRVERDRSNSALYRAAVAIEPTAENRELYEDAQRRWLGHCWESERLEDEMWLRLAKMRSHLW